MTESRTSAHRQMLRARWKDRWVRRRFDECLVSPFATMMVLVTVAMTKADTRNKGQRGKVVRCVVCCEGRRGNGPPPHMNSQHTRATIYNIYTVDQLYTMVTNHRPTVEPDRVEYAS